MSNKKKIKLFLVDDDALYLKLLDIELKEHADFEIKTYATGERCVADLAEEPDVIILDYLLDGVDKTAINGIDTLDRIKAFNPDIPVIMLSAQDKIDIAVDCMLHKASDYVVKSETAFVRLQQAITHCVHTSKLEKTLNWYMQRM
jgi:two-component system, OmpR family, response regulator